MSLTETTNRPQREVIEDTKPKNTDAIANQLNRRQCAISSYYKKIKGLPKNSGRN